MTSFNGGYRSPGVYVDNQAAGALPTVGVGTTAPCIIGRGQGYVATSERIVFASGSAIPLTYQGINVASIVITGVVSVNNVPTLKTFVRSGQAAADYQVVVGTSPNGPQTQITSITREATGSIPLGTVLTVSYHYTDPTYFDLRTYDNPATVAAVYGPSIDSSTGAIVSPVTFAAALAFANGAATVSILPTNTSLATEELQFTTALAKLAQNYDVNVLVPLFETPTTDVTFITLVNTVKAHFATAAADGIYRIAIIGVPKACDFDPGAVATTLHDQNLVLLWPRQITSYNPITTVYDVIDGTYAAPAAAGVLSGQSVNRGLTNSVLSGIGIAPVALSTLTKVNKDAWSAQGVSVMEIDRLRRLVIRHGVTTKVDTVQSREISVVREQYALISLIQRALAQADLIGDPITSDTPFSVKAIVAGALQTALQANIVTSYTDLLVQQQQLPSGDPTVIKVSYSYSPTYPLDYINVVMILDLNTGSSDVTTSTATS